MITLGFNLHHDASFSIIKDGKLLSHINAERITRIKKDWDLNQEVLDYALEAAGIKFEDIDNVACAFWRPNNFIKAYYVAKDRFLTNETLINWDREVGYNKTTYGYEIKEDLMHLHEPFTRQGEYAIQPKWYFLNFTINEKLIPGYFVNHHLSHCATAFFTSNLEKSACFSLDATGVYPEGSSLFTEGVKNEINVFDSPQCMLGTLYDERTSDIGLGDGTFKAGAMMGLAPYGKIIPEYLGMKDEIITSNHNRKVTKKDSLHLRWQWRKITKHLLEKDKYYNDEDNGMFCLKQSDSQFGRDVAHTTQYIFENGVMKYVDELKDQTNTDNLCIGGGSFLNCTSNGNLRKNGPFKNIYIHPASGDDGTSIGAALYIQHYWFEIPRVKWTNKDRMYGGREYKKYSDGELNYEKVVEYLLEENHVVAWFQGKSEIGPRALGNRSFLADPRNLEIRDYINSKLKKREWFRPFAPVVLAEKASEWFDFKGESPFMLFASQVKQPDLIPGVTHVDGSARVQTVTKEDNPKMHKLLKIWEQKTGIPILLNTSLNLGGEPLVETPEDALNLLENVKDKCNLSLVINNKIID